MLRDHHAHLEDLVRERTAELQAETANHRRTAARVEGINRVFQQSPICATEEELGKICLTVAEAVSGSRFGFIGLLNPDGLFDTLAISNPGWDACNVPPGQTIPVGRNMPLRGMDRTTLREGRSRIGNGEESILAHRDHVPTPDGHPPLFAFMGIPLKQGDRTVGMIGLGNKEGGYDEHDQEDVEVLARGFVEALYQLPPVACDPRAIRQVWQNLLANALKFTRGRDPAVIEVDAGSEGDFIRYSVKDNGVGFNNEYVGKLFVLFQRLHGMDEFEGTGVGLAIVKRFIQKHGGEVHADGAPDQGARFSFTLPRSPLNPPS